MEISTIRETDDRTELRSWMEKNSHWTERNQDRCIELEQRGLMTEAGRKTVIQANNKGPNR